MKKDREHFVTCGQMKVLEKRADADGLSYYTMMENAGRGAAENIMDLVGYRKVINGAGGLYRTQAPAAVADSVSAEKTNEKIIAKSIEISNDSSNDDANNFKTTDEISFANIAVASGVADAENHSDKSDIASGGIKTVIFCGKGNNGGDGFVVARRLSNAGYDVTVVLVDGEPKTEDAVTNFNLLSELSVRIIDMVTDNSALMKLKETPDIIVDAIYGTGFHGKLKSNALRAAIYINKLAAMNDAADDFRAGDAGNDDREDSACEAENVETVKTMIFALDIPSGMGGDLVEEEDLDRNSVKADYTITFHANKPVHLQKFAAEYCGRIIVVDIGIDEERLWNVEY